MYPILLDTKTGEERSAKQFDTSHFAWTDGNFSCDCNRSIVFDKSDELQKELGLQDNICFGATRFIAVDVVGDLEGYTRAEVLADMNKEYPEELVNRHIK